MTFLFPYMARWHSANRSRYSHLFAAIAAKGHRIIVVQPPSRISAETNFIETPGLENPNIEVRTIQLPRWLWNMRLPWDKFFKKALFTFVSLFEVRRILREDRPDIIVLYNLPQLIYSIGANVPVVFDFADDYIAMFQHEMGFDRRTLLTRAGESILRVNLQRADLVTAVSAPLLAMVNHPRSLLLPNGAALPAESTPGPPVLHQGIRHTIGFVGAFEYFVDLDLILRLAEALPGQGFLLVGSGREFPRIEDQIRKRGLHNVELMGPLPHERAMTIVLEMDVCLNPFVKGPVAHAASPIKVFEYLARRKPVISTRLDELLRLDPNGRVFLYADSDEEFLSAVHAVMRGGEEIENRVNRGFELVRRDHTWDYLAGQFIDACATLGRPMLNRHASNEGKPPT